MSALYIQVPFCASRCLYCDFCSCTLTRERALYLPALFREAEERRAFLKEPIKTLYLGGGTPSVMGTEWLMALWQGLSARFDLTHLQEVTLEANPEDVATGVCDVARLPWVNRVSMGVQSMVDSELRVIGRRHNAEAVRTAVARLRASGIHNLSLDLIIGLPTQTLPSWETTLDAVLTLRPRHLSAYYLSVEAGTPLDKAVQTRQLQVASDEACLDMAQRLHERLAAEGYQQYEISNYAQIGYLSRHNTSYWTGTPYLGLGPGAHSYDGCDLRTWNEPDIVAYLHGKRAMGSETLIATDRYNERLMLGLRTAWGVAESDLRRSSHALQTLIARGWLTRVCHPTAAGRTVSGQRIVLTPAGRDMADEAIRQLML